MQSNLRYLHGWEVNFVSQKITRILLSKNKVGVRQICKTLKEKCLIYFQTIMRKEYKRACQGHRNQINL